MNDLIPEWVILARQSREMTTEELAREAMMPLFAVVAIELGEKVATPAELKRIAKALEYPVAFFLRTDEMNCDRPPHMNCIASEAQLALAEEETLRARLRLRVKQLSALSLRDALHAIEEVRRMELARIDGEALRAQAAEESKRAE